jgi:DNA-binding PadR family transcriptional regulator
VYTTLDRLLRDGLVEQIGPQTDAGQRTYRITEDGRRDVKRWLEASPVDADPPRDELIMKVLLAIGRGPEEAIALLDDQRAALLVGLQMRRRRQRAEDDGGAPAKRLAHDAVLSRIEADLAWLERCEELMRAATPGGRQR